METCHLVPIRGRGPLWCLVLGGNIQLGTPCVFLVPLPPGHTLTIAGKHLFLTLHFRYQCEATTRSGQAGHAYAIIQVIEGSRPPEPGPGPGPGPGPAPGGTNKPYNLFSNICVPCGYRQVLSN